MKVNNSGCNSESDCSSTITLASDDSDDSRVEDTMITPIDVKQETPQDVAKNFLKAHFETFHESKKHSVSRFCKTLVLIMFVSTIVTC